MKSTFAAATALLAFSTSAVAQTFQSKPFFLLTKSSNAQYNNAVLSSCHEGAAIESLCLSAPNTKPNATTGYETYYLNTTQAQTGNTANLTGVLIWNLVFGGGAQTESEPMSLYRDPSTNVALPLFEPSYTNQFVGFDENNHMYISSALNDTVNPPTFISNRKIYNWYACKTNFEGYVYETLSWVDGIAKPQNPTCVKVTALRQFV